MINRKWLQFRLKLQPVNFYTNINLAYQDEPKYCKEVNRLIESRLMIITMDEETDIQIDDRGGSYLEVDAERIES